MAPRSPAAERPGDTRSFAKADPGVFPPLPLGNPRWGRTEEVGRGSPPATNESIGGGTGAREKAGAVFRGMGLAAADSCLMFFFVAPARTEAPPGGVDSLRLAVAFAPSPMHR